MVGLHCSGVPGFYAIFKDLGFGIFCSGEKQKYYSILIYNHNHS